MANMVITKVGSNGVYVDFGVYAGSKLKSPQGFNSNTIISIRPTPTSDGTQVLVQGRDAQVWQVCHTTLMNYMTIDTIDGVAPTSQADLINKLTALM